MISGPVLLILLVLVVAAGLGFLTGGRLSGFDEVRLRWWPLALLGLAMQLVPVPDLGDDLEDIVGVALLIASFGPLLAFATLNLRSPGFPLVLIGMLMNLLVISVNAGMPVTREALVASGQEESLRVLEQGRGSKHHLADEDEDRLLFLADAIGLGWPFNEVVSAGDLVLYAGAGWYVFGALRAGAGARPEPSPERGRARGAHRKGAAGHRRPGPEPVPPGPPPASPPAARRSGTPP